MKVLLVEDEKLARENLLSLLEKSQLDIEVVGEITTVNESIAWFKNGNTVDLAFFDIQLNDGISFDIFENCTISCPVIFTSSYDEYIINAFNFNGIDYLLKPLNFDRILESLKKYDLLKNHFSIETNQLKITELIKTVKSRLIVHKGNYFVSIETNKIAYIHSENKISFIVTFDEVRYISDHNLSEIESMLDKNKFFRANRQFIVNINSICRFRPHLKGKILLEINPKTTEEITVSQENAFKFKNWISS